MEISVENVHADVRLKILVKWKIMVEIFTP